MRVVIVDNESFARARLARLCEAHADLDVIAQTDSGAAALAAIRAFHPDIVLLDIELRDMSGFDVLQSLDEPDEPLVILVAEHAEYALKAFETDAVDFLTKPVAEQRFESAIRRARQRRPGVRQAPRALHQLVGEKAQRLYFIEPEAVDYIEADGNYVNIHAGGERYITRNSIKHLEAVLASHDFVRIERSLLVNFHQVAFAERLGRGVFALTLRSGARLASSMTYRAAILAEVRCSQPPMPGSTRESLRPTASRRPPLKVARRKLPGPT